MTELTPTERALIELVRDDSVTVRTAIAYTRYHGKELAEVAVSEYERDEALRLQRFANLLEAAADWRTTV